MYLAPFYCFLSVDINEENGCINSNQRIMMKKKTKKTMNRREEENKCIPEVKLGSRLQEYETDMRRQSL